ncbi:TetR/AcrR family transcriptional regulator [soil metagenome]
MKPSSPSTDRLRIVQVAESIFLSKGFSRVLMDDLATELGMSKKTLYRHFDSKEALLRAVLKNRIATGEVVLREIVAVKEAFPVKMRKLVHFVHGKISESGPMFMEDIRRYAPGCFEIIEEFRARAIPVYFGTILDEGIAEGYLRPDLQRDLLIRMLVLSIQGIVRPGVVEQLHLLPTEALDGILSIVFRGAFTAEGRRLRPFSPKL